MATKTPRASLTVETLKHDDATRKNIPTAEYPRAKREVLDRYVQDSVCDTWELLADAVLSGGVAAVKKAGWPQSGNIKHEWAEKIGPFMSLTQNVSPSFGKFRDGLTRIVS